MLYFQSQNDKKKIFPTGRVYSKKQTRVTANQYILKPDLIRMIYFLQTEHFHWMWYFLSQKNFNLNVHALLAVPFATAVAICQIYYHPI